MKLRVTAALPFIRIVLFFIRILPYLAGKTLQLCTAEQ